MVKIRRGLGMAIIVVLLVSIGILVLVPLACTSGQEVKNSPFCSGVNSITNGNSLSTHMARP